MINVLLICNLILKTYLADGLIGCSNPPQGINIGLPEQVHWNIPRLASS